MKVMLFAILDHTEATEELLRRLSKEGYNGTVVSSAGMHHVLPKLSGESVSVSLSMIADDLPSGNLTLYIVIEEEKLDALKKEIRDATENWTKVKGGMFVLPLLSVEGTF
ncbi:MAG: hypothetical protein II467_02565 [Bacilli bacterium]|jgi:uncharacterized protein YaaQ|nr:hypothetical protein [Bacilli bacterium]MBQ4255964.1 hypothetical protein [Bacilli bacterium]